MLGDHCALNIVTHLPYSERDQQNIVAYIIRTNRLTVVLELMSRTECRELSILP